MGAAVGAVVGAVGPIEHLQQALHHLAMADEHALAKGVLLRLAELQG